MKSYAPLLLSLLCTLSWVYLIVPFILRSFGLSSPFGFQKRRQVLQQLSLPKFITWYGVLTCGIAYFVFFVSHSFFEWRLTTVWASGFVPMPFASGWRVLIMLFTAVVGGALLGWLSRPKPNVPLERP
jgi:hypothetical protein